MQKATLALLFAFAAAPCALHAHAAMPNDIGSTTGWTEETGTHALAEEFAKCSVFNSLAAGCARSGAGAQREQAAARHADLAKRFYRGCAILAGQDFTQKQTQFHDTSMRRRAGSACADFSKLEQQYQKRCDDTFKRLPRKLQQP
ncbi:MAG: hypothetical protein LBC79_00070 [Deltaproteobacteria bacterium]|jgi:hypothetical protein|nr:hypothetical protein [Deltaproteobacteria bacterium]